MHPSRIRRWLGVTLAATLSLAACTAAATPTPTQAPTAAPTAATTTAPTATPLPGTKTFAVVSPPPGLSTAPLLAALETMKSQGYNITFQVIEAVELVSQGIAQGQFAIGTTATNSLMVAVEKGATMKGFMARVKNEWTLYVKSATIKTCADLNGKRVAINSEGAISSAFVRNYVTATCPGTTPNYVIIAGSPNRVAALLADQIDASPVELSDSLTLEADAQKRFSLLSSFAKDLPSLQTTFYTVNTQFARDNPGTVVALVKAVLAEHRRIAGNAAGLEDDAKKGVSQYIDPKNITAAAKAYTDLNMFDVNGGLTPENVKFSHDFFGPNGTKTVGAGLTMDAWSDLSFLNMALAEIGKK
jgi:NitT/TauT family transport system substrate-binding protein